MMNIFVITLVLTTLLTAGVFSPIPEKKEEVIVKEGHRVVVVEYEPNDGNTKVSISPQETDQKATAGVVSDVKDKISDTAEAVKDKIKEATSFGEGGKENGGVHKPTARELVCDAFGKCKHRIASALGGTKESISGKMHEIEEDAKATVENVYEKVKDTVVGKAHEASEKVSEVKEKTKDSVKEMVKEGAKETVEKVKGKAKDVADTTKTLKGDMKRNASADLDIIEEKAKAAKDAVKEDAHRLKVEGKRDYQIIRRFLSAKNFRSLMGMIHLLGFALSYGVCIWVTFISSNILARALPKQQFAMVQSKIYPVYFKTLAYGITTAFLGHFMSQRHRYYYANRAETIQGFLCLATICMALINSFVLEPRASKVMRERMKLEKEEGKGEDIFSVEPSTSSVDALKDPTGIKIGKQATSSQGPAETHRELSEEAARMKPQVERLSQKLKKLNFVSSFFNVLTLVALSYHLVYLSQLVRASSY
ncbi:uncharacterized protein LOC107786840 [Nicotiana tabacum]|uniref:Uncharacterized protein LOC107786840 n=1 Tax=Nicotiana tabacum TaxID=4097 RepID=A0A1S3ZHR5_TOBAC